MPPRAKRVKTIIARRQDLIRGTIESVARLGYDKSTVQTICEAAGLSRGLIGHYFTSKDDLLIEAFRFLTEQLGEETRRVVRSVGPDPYQRLLAVVGVTFREPMADKEKAPRLARLLGHRPLAPGADEDPSRALAQLPALDPASDPFLGAPARRQDRCPHGGHHLHPAHRRAVDRLDHG